LAAGVNAVAIDEPSPGATVIDLGYARLQGTYNATTDHLKWMGVKYAQAPVGECRGKLPIKS
jgi:carboxylesterase type B